MRRSSNTLRLLRWYPRSWRDRYGSEFTALLDDVYRIDGLSFAQRLSVRRAGLVERWRASGLTRATRDPERTLRAGALVVLCSWTLMMVAGASVAKASEHFASALPSSDRSAAQIAINVVRIGGVVGVAVVMIGATSCLPAFIRFVRSGRWRVVARLVTWAIACTATSALALVGLVIWGQHLSSSQRNGSDLAYSLTFLLVASIGVATLTVWTAAAVKLVNHVGLGSSVLRLEGSCAIGATVAMGLVTVGTIGWFVQMALHAPTFIAGSSEGFAALLTPEITATVAAMVVASAASVFGSMRVAAGWRIIASRR